MNPSQTKPGQAGCGGVNQVAHLHRRVGGGCVRWQPLGVVATRLLHDRSQQRRYSGGHIRAKTSCSAGDTDQARDLVLLSMSQ
jgi:hypothetical protein